MAFHYLLENGTDSLLAENGNFLVLEPATFTTTGALTGPGSTVAGTAQDRHATSGALIGPGSVIVGAAFSPHLSTGALTGPGSVIVSSAVSPHLSTGILVGAGSVIVGTAQDRHASTGALVGPGSVIVGSAASPHLTSGVLVGPGAVIAGAAVRTAASGGIYVDPCYWLAGYAQGDDASIDCPAAASGVTTGAGTGGTRKRKRYIIAGHDLWLTDLELRDALAALLFAPSSKKPRTRRGRKSKRILPGSPASPQPPESRAQPIDPLSLITFPAAPRFDALWGQRWVQQQAEIANMLRELALEAEEREEEDIAMMMGEL